MSGPRKFRRRQQIVEAMQYDGSTESLAAIAEWVGARPRVQGRNYAFAFDGVSAFVRYTNFVVRPRATSTHFDVWDEDAFDAEFEPVDTESEPLFEFESSEPQRSYGIPHAMIRSDSLLPVGIEWCETHDNTWRSPDRGVCGFAVTQNDPLHPPDACRFVPLYRKEASSEM